MGGRGNQSPSDHYLPDRFLWIQEVSTERLQSYIDRSEYINSGSGVDPQGRHIHTVSFYAKRELDKRGK